MIKDREKLDLPDYLHVLTGHYVRDETYSSVRTEGTDDFLLIYTLRGSGRFQSAGQSFTTEPGDVSLIRPGTGHDYHTAPGATTWELLWAHFHPRAHWYDWLTWSELIPGIVNISVIKLAERDLIVQAFTDMDRYANASQQKGIELAMNALEKALLLCEMKQEGSKSELDSRVTSTMAAIEANLAERISVAELAEKTHLSASRLAHLFKSETGNSLIEYLSIKRIERAKVLLARTSNRISDIGAAVGMDPVTFAIRFKQHTGISPRTFRSAYRTQPRESERPSDIDRLG
ncbi:MAG TPA: helix-turn-helix domain-containing protein [Capsulimonadaceae bacterium]|jgi:AraC family transcriptional regulator of arabinose operon